MYGFISFLLFVVAISIGVVQTQLWLILPIVVATVAINCAENWPLFSKALGYSRKDFQVTMLLFQSIINTAFCISIAYATGYVIGLGYF